MPFWLEKIFFYFCKTTSFKWWPRTFLELNNLKIQIVKNLNPSLQGKLYMLDVTSIEQLKQIGRKAELGRLRTTYNKPPPKPAAVMEPDLAYTQPGPRRMNAHSTLHALDSCRYREDLKCWNCDEKGHPHFKCTQPKKQFCFGCGKADVIKSKCPNCGPKN